MFGYYSFPPGGPDKLHAVELTAFIGANYMISVEPYGISDPDLAAAAKRKFP